VKDIRYKGIISDSIVNRIPIREPPYRKEVAFDLILAKAKAAASEKKIMPIVDMPVYRILLRNRVEKLAKRQARG